MRQCFDGHVKRDLKQIRVTLSQLPSSSQLSSTFLVFNWLWFGLSIASKLQELNLQIYRYRNYDPTKNQRDNLA